MPESQKPLFALPSVLLGTALFGMSLLVLNWAVTSFERIVSRWGSTHRWPLKMVVDIPPFWPMSMVWGVGDIYSARRWFVAGMAAVGFWALYRWAERNARVQCSWRVLVFGIFTVFSTNAVQGWQAGFVDPLMWRHGLGVQYYHDAQTVESTGSFLRAFNQQQRFLGVHGQTHPPGAVLLYYWLGQAAAAPAYIGIILATVSIVLSATFLFLLFATEFDAVVATRTVLLFFCLPSVLIYYQSTLDAVVAALFMGTMASFLRPGRYWAGLAGVLLFAASLLTFGALFLLPVMAGWEAWTRRSVKRSIFVIAIAVMGFMLLYWGFGFHYVRSFFLASRIENPDGFRLLSEPLNYAITRAEDIFEIILFCGPFLSWLFLQGLRQSYSSRLTKLSIVGITTFLAMLLTGAFRTGETARTALFLLPYLLVPVIKRLENASQAHWMEASTLVFAQALLMQVFGYFVY